MDARALVGDQLDFIARSLTRLGVAADVKDLTQEVAIVAIRRADSFDSTRRIEPWLFGIARNVSRDFRRLARHRVEQPDGAIPSDHASAADSPAEHADMRQRAFFLRAAIAALDSPLQELIVLHDLEEIPIAEVAASLGVQIDTAYSRLRRARTQVRACLSRQGATHGTD